LLLVPYLRGNGEPSRPAVRIEGVWRLLIVPAACLLGLCCLPLSAGPALASGTRAQLVPGRGEWWFGAWQVQRKVWPLSQGSGVTVAEVESGVQASLPDLRGVVLPGVDLTGTSRNGDTDIQVGEDGHGTAMAVMIAGQGIGTGAGTGTVGIAPRARILPVTVGGSGPRSVATAAAGIRYAVTHGAQVIDMPFGVEKTSPAHCDPVLQAAVADALGHDVVLIASSGNTSLFAGPDEPASCAGVLAVGGTEPDGTLWPGSTREPYVAVASPGDHMVYVGRDGRFTTTGARPAPAAATSGAPSPASPWRLRLPLREIVVTGVAAVCAFVVVLLAVLWMSSRRMSSRRSRPLAASAHPGTPGKWEERAWSFGPDEGDDYGGGWP
jgi:subtilisin family serine protease